MGDKLVWNKRYEIGVEVIDKEHKKLFRILGRLFDFRQQEEKSQWVCQETTLPALGRELEQMDYSENAIEHFLGVCAGWLVGHALVEDQAIVSGTVPERWERLLPEEEQAVLGQVIVSQLHNMFLLNAQQISNCYGVRNSGTEFITA